MTRRRGDDALSSSLGTTPNTIIQALALLTPADVHHGLAGRRVAARASVLATAYAAHPERFPNGLPEPPARSTEVWINPPNTRAIEAASCTTTREPAVSFHAGSAIPSRP
jgi:hypothetical protein